MTRIFLLTIALLITITGCGSEQPVSPNPIQTPDATPLPADAGGPDVDQTTPTAPTVTLLRDEHGTPHIEAANMEAAMFALGYATAQDRMFQMHFARLVMRGRLAEHFTVDETGTPQEIADKQKFNLDLIARDRRALTYGYARHAERIWSLLPGDMPQLLQAYARGVNKWLKSPNFSYGHAFATLGITQIAPWKPADSLLVWDRIGSIFSPAKVDQEIKEMLACEAGACNVIPCERPLDETAAIVQQPASGVWPPQSGSMAGLSKVQGGDRHPPVSLKASHGFVVSGAKTTTGKPLLVGEPKISVVSPSHWYEFHLAVPSEDVNVRGVGFAGAPGVAIFWSKYASQTITAGGGDVGDLFELTAGAAPGTYVVDGVEHTYNTINETILVKGKAPVTVTVRESMFGPVVTEVLANPPPAREFALRHTELIRTNNHSLTGAVALMRAHDTASYQDALRSWHVPTVNALYAGVDRGASPTDTGHIGFHSLLAIPKRQPIDVDGVDMTGRVPYDGSTAQNDWNGVWQLEMNPHVIDPPEGFALSGNHLAVGQWHHDLVYSGLAGVGDTFRSLRLRYLLTAAVGATGAKATPQALHMIHHDARSTITELYLKMLQYLRDQGVISSTLTLDEVPTTPEEKAIRALEILELWQAEGGLLDSNNRYAKYINSIGPALVKRGRYKHNPQMSCKWHSGTGGASAFAKAFDADPSAMGPLEVSYAISVAETWFDQMVAKYPQLPTNPTTWPTPAQFVFPIGHQLNFMCLRWDSKTSGCSINPSLQYGVVLERHYVDTICSANGSSYPVTVDYGAATIGRSLLPPGSNEDPTSPHFNDRARTLEKYARGLDVIPEAPIDLTKVTALSTESFTLPATP